MTLTTFDCIEYRLLPPAGTPTPARATAKDTAWGARGGAYAHCHHRAPHARTARAPPARDKNKQTTKKQNARPPNTPKNHCHAKRTPHPPNKKQKRIHQPDFPCGPPSQYYPVSTMDRFWVRNETRRFHSDMSEYDISTKRQLPKGRDLRATHTPPNNTTNHDQNTPNTTLNSRTTPPHRAATWTANTARATFLSCTDDANNSAQPSQPPSRTPDKTTHHTLPPTSRWTNRQSKLHRTTTNNRRTNAKQSMHARPVACDGPASLRRPGFRGQHSRCSEQEAGQAGRTWAPRSQGRRAALRQTPPPGSRAWGCGCWGKVRGRNGGAGPGGSGRGPAPPPGAETGPRTKTPTRPKLCQAAGKVT